jgi:mRNA-degrading endonuclease RelE of RelBE toxin-antitoxin system
MSRYNVVWSADAIDELAEIWLQASDRAAVTSAQAAIDRQLALDPSVLSTEVAEGLHKLVVAPLKVYFEVDEGSRLIKITAISPRA